MLAAGRGPVGRSSASASGCVFAPCKASTLIYLRIEPGVQEFWTSWWALQRKLNPQRKRAPKRILHTESTVQAGADSDARRVLINVACSDFSHLTCLCKLGGWKHKEAVRREERDKRGKEKGRMPFHSLQPWNDRTQVAKNKHGATLAARTGRQRSVLTNE